MSEPITYVGIDAHKSELQVAVLAPDAAEPTIWTVRNEVRAVNRLRRRLERDAPRSTIRERPNRHRVYWVFARADVSGSEQKYPARSSFGWQYGWQYRPRTAVHVDQPHGSQAPKKDSQNREDAAGGSFSKDLPDRRRRTAPTTAAGPTREQSDQHDRERHGRRAANTADRRRPDRRHQDRPRATDQSATPRARESLPRTCDC